MKADIELYHETWQDGKMTERKRLSHESAVFTKWPFPVQTGQSNGAIFAGSSSSYPTYSYVERPTLQVRRKNEDEITITDVFFGYASSDDERRALFGYNANSGGYLSASLGNDNISCLNINLSEVPVESFGDIKIVTLRNVIPPKKEKSQK